MLIIPLQKKQFIFKYEFENNAVPYFHLNVDCLNQGDIIISHLGAPKLRC